MACKRPFYDVCTDPREKPQLYRFDEDLAKKIATDFRILPTFEKTLFDELQTEHYSMRTHKLLRCRWKQYKQHAGEIRHEPYHFPSNRDMHFYCQNLHFMPALSPHTAASFRVRMATGPGVDNWGQLPIPVDLNKRGDWKVERPKKLERKIHPVLKPKRIRKD